MPSGKITIRAVNALEKSASDQFLWDDELRGFGVKITPAGKRSYVYQYRLGGREAKTKRWTIGGHGDPWSPASARTEAERLATLIGQGVDPVGAEKKRRKEAVTLAFDAYVETFSDGYLEPEWGSSWKSAKRMLEMHVVPVLGKQALPTITASDLNPVFDKLRSQPASQRNVYAVTRKLFAWAEKRDDIAYSPFTKMDAPTGVKARKRVLSPDELVALWRASFALDGPRGQFVRLLMATLQRRVEVAGLPWTEVSKDKEIWHLPGFRAKNGEDHLVPLSALSMSILGELKWKRRGFVFPSATGETPISNFSDIKRSLDAEMLPILQELADQRADTLDEDRHKVELAAWRLHDIRRTGTTQMQQLGFPIEVSERVINHHKSGEAAGIRGIYNLYAYQPEKTRALEAWGKWLDQLIKGAEPASNVVPIAATRA